MDYNISLFTKAKSIAFVFSLLSIIALLYYLIQPSWLDARQDHHKYNLSEYVHIIAILLVLITNLLLYQAILDISCKSLYYWPNPKYCLLSWLIVHCIVMLLLFSNMVSCFHSLRRQDFASTHKDQETSSKINLIPFCILLALGQMLILLGMKTVLNVFAEHKNSEE